MNEEYEKGLQNVLQSLYESLAATLFMDTSITALNRIFDVRLSSRSKGQMTFVSFRFSP